MKPYLSYYKKINAIPVVDIKDLKPEILFKQRFNFYFKLGITPGELKNKSVLELCAGTGYNAFYLINNKIKSIDLVEGNTPSINYIKK